MGIRGQETPGLRALMDYDGTIEGMRRLLNALLYNKAKITPQLVELRNAAANRPGAPEARRIFGQGTQRLMQDPNLRMKFEMTHTLPRLTVPAMFIWGENDEFALPEQGRQAEKLLPNIPFKWIPQAGHQAQTDQPELVAKLMFDFFSA
jgi:pimeloyl-ACP methyl ester carboxylesterase